jgi:hypothetical protein
VWEAPTALLLEGATRAPVIAKAVAALAKEDKIEYIYLGASFIKLKGK